MTRILTFAGLSVGFLFMFLSDRDPPAWLMRLEVLLFSACALAFGYSAWKPVAPSWYWSQPVQGVMCLYFGMAALFIPPQFIVSATFIGVGTRMILEGFRGAKATVIKAVTVRTGDIIRRRDGSIVRESCRS